MIRYRSSRAPRPVCFYLWHFSSTVTTCHDLLLSYRRCLRECQIRSATDHRLVWSEQSMNHPLRAGIRNETDGKATYLPEKANCSSPYFRMRYDERRSDHPDTATCSLRRTVPGGMQRLQPAGHDIQTYIYTIGWTSSMRPIWRICCALSTYSKVRTISVVFLSDR
ncbi:hypothetical protein BD324DRAFT_259195 [Kockovaella imperatae]|uniref:Uncharacterized protein n=1 Tax=Kockovaella imperatae TaxID=4999 RepID=A0A1Y1URQ3_9TREE|nr:hypothetical protein BD324DRAFT_259195 [Kockovaella imperatae]ORX40116.1 hypothetical protein BD324DRAFT_259195 [Kockovaella imperatae]